LASINSVNLQDQKELENLIKIFKKHAPYTYKVFVDERDFFIANQLFQIIKQNPINKKIVVVIGAGHLLGVRKYFEQLIKGEMSEREFRRNLRRAVQPRKIGFSRCWV